MSTTTTTQTATGISLPTPPPRLRPAGVADVPAIHALIQRYAGEGLVLPRSMTMLYEQVRDYTVVEVGDHVVGCTALHVLGRDLAEIRSLAVKESHRRHGLGRRLVQAGIEEARRLGVDRVFALTHLPEFFQSLGFVITDKRTLPQKVWTECIHCPKFPVCDEIAVELELQPGHDGEQTTAR